jgi:predicted small lipoprotein YifL
MGGTEMKRLIAGLLMLLLLCPVLTACGKEEPLEPWVMPAVDQKPTPVPTPMPVFGGGSPERYVWNEAALLLMNNPGAAPGSLQENYTHRQCLALFPYNFLPSSIFGESYASYEKLSIKRVNHDVMLDGQGQLAEHAYIEFQYLPKSGKEEKGITVMAELCSLEAAQEIYNGLYPHLMMPQGERLRVSTYYLKDFVLAKVEQQRVAQILKLTPSSYFIDSRRALAEDESFRPQRQILLTVTCGLDMSDEEFIAAACYLLRFSDGSEIVTPEPSRLPKMGEKGAA